jgi:ketosteroid isomerase-like protein
LSEEANTKLIQGAYGSIQTGDIPAFLSILAENVLWILPDMSNVSFAGVRQGPEQVGQFFHRMAEVQDLLEFEPKEFIAQRETVVVLGHFKMRIKATDKIASSGWAHVWKVDNGKVSYMREYVDTLAVSRAHSGTGDR